MFNEILNELDPDNLKCSKLKYYLDRHVEVDSEVHGPIARKMMEELGVEVQVIKNLGFFEEFFESTEQDKNLDFHCISFVFLLHVQCL